MNEGCTSRASLVFISTSAPFVDHKLRNILAVRPLPPSAIKIALAGGLQRLKIKILMLAVLLQAPKHKK